LRGRRALLDLTSMSARPELTVEYLESVMVEAEPLPDLFSASGCGALAAALGVSAIAHYRRELRRDQDQPCCRCSVGGYS
jgi:hypothetical protein